MCSVHSAHIGVVSEEGIERGAQGGSWIALALEKTSAALFCSLFLAVVQFPPRTQRMPIERVKTDPKSTTTRGRAGNSRGGSRSVHLCLIESNDAFATRRLLRGRRVVEGEGFADGQR